VKGHGTQPVTSEPASPPASSHPPRQHAIGQEERAHKEERAHNERARSSRHSPALIGLASRNHVGTAVIRLLTGL
jgi:hypothetical protein